MNEEAIQHAYDLFTNDGYTKSVDEFKTLMSSNPDALAHSYGLFQSDGYSKSLEEFQALMAGNQVKEEVKKKDPSTDTTLPTEGGESVSGGSDLLDTSIQDREAQGHQTDISLFTDGSDKDTVAAAAEQERGIFYEEQGLDFKKINELKKKREELEEEKNVYQENVLNTKFELNGGIKKDDKFFIPKDKGFFESQKTIEEGGYDEVTKDKALDFATGTTAVNMAMTIGDYVLPGGGSEGDRSERSILDDIGSVEEELNESRPQVIEAEEAYNTQITNSFLEQGYRGERLNQLMDNADIKQEYVKSKLFTINGAESTGVTIEEGIYDDDFISGLQDGSIKVDIHPSIKDTDYGRYLENAIAVQSNAGGELGDIKDAFMAGGFGTVAGTLEVLEIGEGVDSSLEYSDEGGIVAREFKDVQDQYTDMQRMYQYPGFMQSFRAGEYADAGFQLGRGIAGSTVQIGISYIGRKLKIPQKYLMGFIGVSAAGQKSLSLKEQRREGNLDMNNWALALNALLSGTAEAVWEIPTFQIIEGIQQMTKGAGKAAVRDVTKKAVDGLLKDLLKEGGSEAGTTVTEMIVDHVTGAGTPESFDEIVNEVGNAFVTGVGMAGGMRAVGGSAAVTASVINKLTGVDLTNRIVATIKTVNEDGSENKKELTQAELREWHKDPKNKKAEIEGSVRVEYFTKDLQDNIQDLVDSVSEDVVDANESVDVVGREVNSEINELGNDLKGKDSSPSEGRVSRISQLLGKMSSLIDGSSSNRGVDLKALKDVFNDMMSKAGFSVNDNVTNQNTDNANIESTENITEIQSKEQANAIEKALDKGENLSVVLSQDGVGVSKNGKSVSKNNIKLGEFKSTAEAKKALDAFNKKNAEQKQKRHVEVQKKNNKEFKKADKGKMDDVSQEDLDGDFNIMSAELDGLDAATNDKRTDNLEKVLKNKGLKYKKVTTIENGVSKTSFMVEGVESNQALSIASGFGQKSITSSKDGVLHSDGTVEALDGNTYKDTKARNGARVIVIKQNGKKKAIRLGTGKKSFAKKFNSNNIADIAKFVEYLPENQKKILGHVLNFFSKIQGLNIGIVKNTYAMKLQLEADGYSTEDINKYAGNRAIYRGSDGTMYLNLEVMNMNTAFHEIIHPLVDFIKNTDSETRNKAIKEIEESQAYKDADAEGKKQMIDTIPKGVYSKIEDMVSKAEPGMIGSPFRKRWIDSNGRRQSGSYLDWVKGQKAYKDLSRKAQIEEAFAEMMGDAAANQFQKDNSKLKQIYDAIREMLSVFNANIPADKNLASLDLSDLQNIGDLRSGIGSALAKGTSLNVGGVDFTFSKTEGEIREQAADLLSEKENLADFGLDSEKRNTLRTLGAALDARQRKKYKVINKGTTTDKASDYISDFIKDEVIYSIDNIEDSGLGWYEEKYQRALNNLAEVNDFMKEGEPSRDLFTMLLAITSDGIEVSKNLEFAEILTKEYVETGSIDSSKIKFGGKSRKSMVTNVNNIIDLLNRFDGDMMKVKEFLTVEKSVSEFKKDYPKMVKKSEYEQTGASADKIKLPMAAMIFGPKLGAFYGNLTGGAGYLTMDRWFSRTFNRYRGIVKTPLDKKRYDRAREAILKLKGLEKKYNLDYGIKLSSSKNLSKDNVVSTAKKIASLYVKNNKRRESLPEELKKNESLLNSFAKDYGGLQDSPFNKSDRTFMYESVWKAQEKLAKEGRDVTVADIQAILWYFEKSLYKKFNVQGPPIISYEEATLRAIPDFKAQAPQVEEVQWQESRIGRGDLAITNRSEEVRESAQDYFDKKITLQDHLDVIQENSPIKPITQFMNPASLKDIKTAVGSKVEGKLDVSIQEGTKVGVRLDISAYTNKNIWTITVHEDGRGKAMSYTNVARINNVEFISSPKVALNIARGKSSKATIARILGEWSPLEGADAKARGESAKQIVVEVMNDPSWSQIGMNPFRHSYFYDRLDGMPVVNAEQVVQIGGLVYAKNAEKTTPFDERFEDKRTGLKFQADDNDGFTGGRSQYARFNVTPNTDRPNALIEDLSEDRVSEIAMKGNWSIITGTVEAEGKYNNEANVSNNAKLYKELVEEFGTENIEVVQGVYMREDQGPSLFVTGITEHRAMQIGKSYSQEGVLTRRGNIFTDGSGMNPASETVFVGDNALNKDGNSTTTSGVTFSLDVDWGTKVPLATGIKAQAMDNMEYTPNALVSLSMIDLEMANTTEWISKLSKGVKGTSKDIATMGLEDILKAYQKEAKVKSIPKEVVAQLIATNMAEIETKILSKNPVINYDDYYVGYDGDTYGITTPEGLILNSGVEVTTEVEELSDNERKDIIEEGLDGLLPVSKYSEVTLPGGDNYREFLIRDKSSEDIFTAPHYDDFGENLIASVRADDRVGPNGEKVLFVQEIQSDWVQGTNKDNFKTKNEVKELESKLKSLRLKNRDSILENVKPESIEYIRKELSIMYPDGQGAPLLNKFKEEIERLSNQLNYLKPYLPWNQTDLWLGLAIRKVINQASKEGYDQIAFVNGKQSDIVQQHTGEMQGKTHEFYNNIVPKNINNELKRLVKGMRYGVGNIEGITDVRGKKVDQAVINLTPELKAATDKVGPLRFQVNEEITDDQLQTIKSTYSDIKEKYPNINIDGDRINLYHYSNDNLESVDPDAAVMSSYSREEFKTWGRGRVFFYTDPNLKEGIVTSQVKNETSLPIDKVYPLTEDPLGLSDIALANIKEKRSGGNKTMSTITIDTKVLASANISISHFKAKLRGLGLADVVNFESVEENNSYAKNKDGKYVKDGVENVRLSVTYPEGSDNITSLIKETFDGSSFERINPATIPINTFEELAIAADNLGFQGFIYDHVGGKTVSSWKPVSVVGDRFQAASQEDTDVYVSGLGAIMWDLAKPIIDADYKLGGWASNVRKPDRRYKKKDSEGLMVSTVRATELFLMPKGLHTNQQIKEMIIAGRAQLNHQLYVANKNQKNLKKVIEAEEKRIKSEDSYKNATPEQQEAMLEHLTPEALNNTMSSVDAILALPEQSKLREAMTTVRNHIDVLSITMYEEGLVSGPMRYTIEGNLGYYLTRSYNQYEDSDWRQKDQEVIRRAEVFVMNKLMSEPKNMSREDAEVRAKIMVNNIVNQKDSEIGIKFIKNSGISRPLHRVGSIFEKRNEALPKEIRELLGERMDPLTNYVNTVSKLSRTLISNQMYEDMIDFGMGKFISDPTLDDPEISMMGQEVNNKLEGKKWGPLDGKFVDNEMLDVLKFYDDADGEMGLATKAWMTFVFATKKAATVYNPATHAVNLFGNSYFSLLNGHTSPAKFFESFRVAAGQITNLNGKERQAFYEELISLGVVDSSASLAEIVEIGKDLIKEGVDMNKIMDKLGNRMAGKSAKFLLATAGKADKVATSAYQAEDDLFKIFGYLSEKAKYMEAGLSEKESKSRAVRNTANLYPNYGRIPAIIRAIGRNNFVGTFVSFTSESIRCTKNALKLSLDEMGDPNPKIKKMGAKRLAASLLTLKFAESLTSTAISMLFGAFGDDEEEFHKELFGLRHLVAPWDKDGKIAPINKGFFERGMDGFTEENNGHAFVEYMNTSRLSGGGFVKDLLRIAFTDMNSPDYKNTMGRILYKFYSAFLSEDMALGVVRDIIENKGNKYYNPTDHFLEISWDVLTNGLFYKLGPGIFKSGVRIQESMQEGSDKITSNEIRAMFGLRTTTLDVNNSLFFKSKEIIKDMTDRSESLEFDLRQKDMTLAYTLNPNHEMFDNKMSQYFNGLVSAVQTARRLGVNISGTKDNCIDMLKKANVPQEVIDKVIYNVLNGEGSETLRIGDK